MSNSETLVLTWIVTPTGLNPVNITYYDTHELNRVDILSTGITASLMNFERQAFIVSRLSLTITSNDYLLDGAEVECRSRDEYESAEVSINASGT